MNVQYITDDTGKTTGVFIPIEDWEEMKAVYPDLENLREPYKLSDKQKDILDSQDDLDDSDYQNNDYFIKELKNGLI